MTLWNLLAIRLRVQKVWIWARPRTLYGVANPRWAARPVCGLCFAAHLDSQAFAPRGQIMNSPPVSGQPFFSPFFFALNKNPHSVFRQDAHANSSLKIRDVILMTGFLMRDYFDAGYQGLSCGMSLTQYRWIILNTRYSAGHDASTHSIPIAS